MSRPSPTGKGARTPLLIPHNPLLDMEELEGPGPEFMAATSLAQLAPLLFDAADHVDKLGTEPEHVAVAEETVRAFLERQDLDLDRSVATVTRVEDGVKIEYEDRTVTITYGDE
ncbi:MAG: hypothetical protein ABEK84_05085 [Salinibacter sp.]